MGEICGSNARNNAWVGNGQAGGLYVADTTARQTSGRPFGSFFVMADAKFEVLEGVVVTGLADVTAGSAITLEKGMWLFGNVNRFKLHSGAVIAYYLR